MDEHDFYDDLDVEDMDGIDDEDDLWDLEGEANLSTPAGVVAAVPAAAARRCTSGPASTMLPAPAGTRSLDWSGATKYKPVKLIADNALNPTSTLGSYIRSALARWRSPHRRPRRRGLGRRRPVRAGVSSEDIDRMEALAEEAAEADGEDAILAADEMVSRSFGVMRASARMRPIIAALRDQVRRIVVMAKREPAAQVAGPGGTARATAHDGDADADDSDAAPGRHPHRADDLRPHHVRAHAIPAGPGPGDTSRRRAAPGATGRATAFPPQRGSSTRSKPRVRPHCCRSAPSAARCRTATNSARQRRGQGDADGNARTTCRDPPPTRRPAARSRPPLPPPTGAEPSCATMCGRRS